ncbi:MAG: MarR family transcriptional regulator [Solirubrobacteraceae bacterium]
MSSAPSPPPAAAGSESAVREAATELGQAFKACVGSVRRLRGREAREHGALSDAQYGLLFGLRHQTALGTSELACLAGLSPATATQMLDGLASAGLVSRVRSERDRRVVLTSLTERGEALVAERHARFAPRWEAALAGFSDSELRTTAAVLDHLRQMFDEVRPGGADGEPAQS